MPGETERPPDPEPERPPDPQPDPPPWEPPADPESDPVRPIRRALVTSASIHGSESFHVVARPGSEGIYVIGEGVRIESKHPATPSPTSER